jgi:hypothetical protein
VLSKATLIGTLKVCVKKVCIKSDSRRLEAAQNYRLFWLIHYLYSSANITLNRLDCKSKHNQSNHLNFQDFEVMRHREFHLIKYKTHHSPAHSFNSDFQTITYIHHHVQGMDTLGKFVNIINPVYTISGFMLINI